MYNVMVHLIPTPKSGILIYNWIDLESDSPFQ